MRISYVCALVSILSASGSLQAQPLTLHRGLHAMVRPLSYQVPLGRPVWVRFSIENNTDEPVTLTVPGTMPAIPSPYAGLPTAHIFSGGSSSALSLSTNAGQRWDEPAGYRPTKEAPILIIAPRGSVGTTLDLREHFPALRGAGQFRITWEPYGGAVNQSLAVVTVAPLKRAQITTDEGTLTIRFFYSDAPAHVANFIGLVESGFYNGQTFHRIEPGYLVQGGCPRGDGTGIRLDGKRIPAEFNGRAMRKGSVAMALLGDDPDSASCQFFLCNTRQKEWDGRYTIFGELVGDESYVTLDRLMNTPVDESGRPLSSLHLRSARLIDAVPEDFPY